jgi:hypothetical protein
MPADPNDVTDECEPLFNTVMGEAEDLLGPRTQILVVRIRTSNEPIPYSWFEGGAAYIRFGAGVGPGANLTPDQLRQLRHQLALETVHVLSVPPGAPVTALEKGAAAYFSVHIGGYSLAGKQRSGPVHRSVQRSERIARAARCWCHQGFTKSAM